MVEYRRALRAKFYKNEISTSYVCMKYSLQFYTVLYNMVDMHVTACMFNSLQGINVIGVNGFSSFSLK